LYSSVKRNLQSGRINNSIVAIPLWQFHCGKKADNHYHLIGKRLCFSFHLYKYCLFLLFINLATQIPFRQLQVNA
jgi:hypothetical protein